MLSLDAEEWKNFEGGYKIPFDASVPLRKLEGLTQPSEKIWKELWEELFHQGDVGIASYASVPQIYKIYREKNWIDFELPSFVSAIEKARLENHNPKLPKWLEEDYFESLFSVAHYCLDKSKGVSDKTFSKSMLLLMASLMQEQSIYQLIEMIPIGEEEKILSFYCENF